MDIRKIILCFAIVILVVVGTICSVRQSEKPDHTAPGKDGEAVNASEDIPDTLEKVSDEYKNTSDKAVFTQDSTVKEVISDPSFGDFGRLLFPVDRTVSEDDTLSEISSSDVYVWYSNIHPGKTVEIVNHLKARADAGEQIYFPIYSEEEIRQDASKADTGLFYFGGTPGEKFAVMNAGGGFMYVGAMHDSFPHALEASKQGYNAFALIYRPDDPYEDLARAVVYLYDHAEELGIQADGYSLWGGSAGARMAAVLGNKDYLQELTGRTDIPQAAAVIMQYTGYTDVSNADAPTYACVGTRDGIALWNTMKDRLDRLKKLGIPTEFHKYDGLSHGFGLGTGTAAEGWVYDAVKFWEDNQ
ncbi:MAG: alpha/beta hydrolase [Clostridium sp.]|nr:alpha/beta hydrolase [Clostridium sp.]